MDKTLFKKTERLLKNYNQLVNEIEMIQNEIEITQSSYIGCGAIGYSEKSGTTNKFSSVVESEILIRNEKLRKLESDLKYKKKLKNRIDMAIKNLSTQEEKDLINLRYINTPRSSWGNVARHLRYNKDHCRKVLGPRTIRKMIDFIFYNPGVQERFDI
ncbi:TPA: DUF722 domain-containing protein [Clostridium perfringens]|nr:DUF722 domain-containing protein [Clostridium perfringens]